ncbi:MAG: DUF3467 domain-containing protein [Candidatus Kerfeldbacteria bacterium]|nr:DUF3467 domain-containing protein [Candidatus Kerfeldbacteria bacterium]
MPEQQQIQLKASDETLKGHYSNMMMVSHTKEEIILDFFNVTAQGGQLVSRIFTSPGHAKRVLGALADNLKKYEAQFGTVTAAPAPTKDFGFAPPQS